MKAAVFAISIAALHFVPSALACSCAGIGQKDAFKAAPFVLLGETVSYDGHVANIRILKQFKGSDRETILVHAEPGGASCGYGGNLWEGSINLLYLHGASEADLWVGLCGRSRQIPAEWLGEYADLQRVQKRAFWWRSPMSSLRLLKWVGYDYVRMFLRSLRLRWAPNKGATFSPSVNSFFGVPRTTVHCAPVEVLRLATSPFGGRQGGRSSRI